MIMKFKIVSLFLISLGFTASVLFAANATPEKKAIESKVVFFGNYPNDNLAFEGLIKDEASFKPYSAVVPAVDFTKNNLLVITRPGLTHEFSLELNDIYELKKEIIVHYSYSTTPAEVMMIGKLLAITLPKLDLPVRVMLRSQDYKNKPVVREKILK